MDSGGSHTIIHRSALPPGCVPEQVPAFPTKTAAGIFQAKGVVWLNDVILPEFTRSLKSLEMKAYVFDSPCEYDIIVGRDWLSPNAFDIRFSQSTMEWFDRVVPMRNSGELRAGNLYLGNYEMDDDDADACPCNYCDGHSHESHQATMKIAESKYDGVDDMEELAESLQHLTKEERKKFERTFDKCHDLFAGKLGRFTDYKVSLELKPGSKPVHMRPYPIARAHKEVFTKEAERLVKEGVLARCGATEHAYPSFIVPKKDGRVRWVSDFRRLNAMTVRRTYGLPRIKDIIARRSKYKYFTKIDLSGFFYTIELDEESSWKCVINTEIGKFRYLRLPMGVCNAPDLGQEIIEGVFHDMKDDLEVFIDDIGIFDDDFDSHIAKVEKVLLRLQEKGFTVNPLKCEWAVQETDWLGYWFTPNGTKPWSKKIDAIARLDPPTNITELRSFIGAVNFYRDMWPRRSHVLAPLTALTGAKTFQWTAEHQKAFETMKDLIQTDALLAFPDHTQPFHIYTDASDYQLGSVIMQDGKPIAYYSRKLNPAQKNYTTIEKELLSIVETLKEFRSILFGGELHIHTDHKNLTYTNLNTQRVLRWRMLIEEYNPTFHYIKGTDNIVADYLSRAPLSEEKGSYLNDSTTFSPTFFNNVFESYFNVPAGPNPISYAQIRQWQQADPDRSSTTWPFNRSVITCNSSDNIGSSVVATIHKMRTGRFVFRTLCSLHSLIGIMKCFFIRASHVKCNRYKPISSILTLPQQSNNASILAELVNSIRTQQFNTVNFRLEKRITRRSMKSLSILSVHGHSKSTIKLSSTEH